MTGPAKLNAALDELANATEQRVVEFPQFPPYQHTREQIALIRAMLVTGAPPSPSDRAKIDMDLMCAKDLEDEDPVLCDLITTVTHELDLWR